MQKMRLRPGLCSGPHWGNSRRSPYSLVGWGGDTLPRLHPTWRLRCIDPRVCPRRHNFWLRHWGRGLCDHSKNSTQLNWTKIVSFLSVVKFWTCSEFHDWQQTGAFMSSWFLEWSYRLTGFNSTQLASWVTTAPKASWVWVESSDVITPLYTLCR